MVVNRKPGWSLIPGDWIQLQRIINELGWRTITSDSSLWGPSGGNTSLLYGSLKLGSLSGVLKASAGVVSGSAAHSALASIGANDHHNQIHTLVGSDHSASGLTPGHVLQALSATTFGFAAISAVPSLHASTHASTGSDPVNHDTLTNVHQDVNTTAAPTFVGVNWTSVISLPALIVVGKVIRLGSNGSLYLGKEL